MTTRSPASSRDPLVRPTPAAGWLPFEEFPFRSRFVEIDGNRIHYLDEGEGPLLLFVHTPMWMFVWRDLIMALRGRFRCVTLDFPSTGLSEAAPHYRGGIPAASKLLEAFIDARGLHDITLVAHDVGGPVALGAAARIPERFRAVVLNGSFGWSLRRHHPQVARFLGVVGSPLFAAVNTPTNALIRLTSGPGGIGRHLSPGGRRAFRGAYATWRSRSAVTRALGDVLEQDRYLDDLEQALPALAHLPILLAYGENDQGRKAGFQGRFEGIFPHHLSVVVEGANHFPQNDAPHELAATIERWWRASVAEPGST